MKKIAVLLTTVLTAGMLAACGQGKNAETTSAGVSDVKTEADTVQAIRSVTTASWTCSAFQNTLPMCCAARRTRNRKS